MKSLCSLNMNSTKLTADTYEDLKVILLHNSYKCKSFIQDLFENEMHIFLSISTYTPKLCFKKTVQPVFMYISGYQMNIHALTSEENGDSIVHCHFEFIEKA